MNISKRKFISVYLPKKDAKGKKQIRNVSMSFTESEMDLYKRMKAVTTSEIKNILGIYSYEQLEKVALKDKRKPSEYIKVKFEEKISGTASKTINVNKKQINKWLETLDKDMNNKTRKEIKDFLTDLLN